jgi:outer membrane protein
MTKPTRILTVLAALCALGTSLPAATPVQVATVDFTRALEEYWKTQKKSGELYEQNRRAQEQVDEFQKAMAAVLEEVKKLQNDANDPLRNQEAKERILAEAQRKADDFQDRRERLQQFVENTQRGLDQERRLFMELMYGEINTVIRTIGQGKGANFIVDTSGRAVNGVSAILYADAAFDITDEVVAELNKSKPADFVPPKIPQQ